MSQAQAITLHSFHPSHRSHPARCFTDTTRISPTSLHSRRQARRRGIILSQQGWHKLQQAGILCNEFGERHTYEYLSEQTLLDPRTICRIVGCEVPVDKRSLKIFFDAFHLELHQEDYAMPKQAGRESIVEHGSTDASPPSTEAELSHLKQQIIESCHCFIQFLKLDSASSVTLSIKFAPQLPPEVNLNL